MTTIQSPIPSSPNDEAVIKPLVRRWLKPDEAADYIGVDRSTFNEWIKKHGVKPAPFSPRNPRYDVHKLDDLMIRLSEVDS